mgnify:CR=1 FL=1
MKSVLIKLRSYAKVNLGLHILGKRTDGYHEIRTVFQAIDLHDTLEIWIIDGCDLEFESNVSELSKRDNLVIRAIQAVSRYTGVKANFAVRLEKSIPMGAGLGGGSSNAAATVMGLDQLLNLRMSKQDWFKIGSQLGADVPFFFVGGRALGLGRGSEVYPLQDTVPCYTLIVVPSRPMPTAEAFRRLRLTSLVNKSKIPVFCPAILESLESGDKLENQFESVIFQWQPELKHLKEKLLKSGAKRAGLTGSGSALVGLFPSKRALSRAQRALEGEDVRLIVTRTMTREQYKNSLVECLHQATR